jgi:hypothetical protein
MAEITIGGLGLFSLLALFQTCNSAYDIFVRSAKNIGRDAHLLSVHMEVERQKLRLWGQYLGISHSEQCHLLRAESFETQRLVVVLLDCIKELLDDMDVITLRYGVKIVVDGEDNSGQNEPLLRDLNLEDIRSCEAVKIAQLKRRETERSVTKSTSRIGKLRWALSDNSKLAKLVHDLRDINEHLWVALPKNQWLKLARGLPSLVLPEISDQVALSAVQGTARENETTQLLAACLDLRHTALILATNESRPEFGENLRIPPAHVKVNIEFSTGDPNGDDTKKRHIVCITKADGTKIAALLEWRFVERSFGFKDKETIRSRIKSLAVLLSSDRPSQFGLLKCIGFFRDGQHETQTAVERYGLLFEHLAMPILRTPSDTEKATLVQFRPRSLHEYIDATARNPPYLGDRFRIAIALCNTLLQIHASSWLHKAIQSSNILFFPTSPYATPADLDTSRPFLTGFDFSRPDLPNANSLEAPKDRTSNDYRHPSLWPKGDSAPSIRYRKRHDIYALGVVLLEVGTWKLVRSLKSSYRDPKDPLLWRDHLLDFAKQLGFRCGKTYQEVVETCLTGYFVERDSAESVVRRDEEEIGIKGSFLFDVVYKLGQCHA